MKKRVAFTALGFTATVLIGLIAKPVAANDNAQKTLVAKQLLAHGKSDKRKSTKRFIGLWRGVDPLDGGILTFSISDNNSDGKFAIRVSDTFLRLCQPDVDAANNGQGIVEGSATVSGDNLMGNLTLKCFGSNNEVPLQWKFELIGDVLKVTGTGFDNDFVTLHKVSKSVR